MTSATTPKPVAAAPSLLQHYGGMSANNAPLASLRQQRQELSLLAWAFAISLMLHAAGFGAFEAGKHFGWWQRLHWPGWLKPPRMLTELLKGQPVVKPLQAEQQIPLVFVEVSEAQATPEPPKDAKYYSNKNSRAANQESEKNLEAPKIEGKNPELVKTEDVPQQKPAPLQPTPPKPEPQPPKEERKPPPPEPKADWALAKTEPELRKESTNKVEKPQKPRTVQEARAQLEQKKLPGQRMKLEGGVSLHSKQDALNAKATPFGDYDWALVEAIQSAWYGRLTEQRYASDYRGKVVVTFQLHYDGRITGLSILENTAGSIPSAICEEAITKPVPYNKFPAEMRRVVGDLRSIQFTFFYD